MVEGRDFTPADRHTGVVVINRVVAERYWPQQDPIGQRLKIGGYTSENPWLTVVGVAENVHHFGLESPPLREIYVPYGQSAWPVMNVVVKARGDITPAGRWRFETCCAASIRRCPRRPFGQWTR